MTLESEPVLLALLTGAGFGAIIHWVWCWSPGKTAAVLVLLYIMQTLAQQVWRVLDGVGTVEEAFIVGFYRLAFAIGAVAIVGLLHRRCE
jgi:hypothetical protein